MKFNWGNGIALVYGLFALTMIFTVIRTRSYDPGLVQNDYYNLDLNYQERLEKKQNTARLPEGIQVRFDAVAQVVRVQFPVAAGAPIGSVKCYRSMTVKDDMLLEVNANSDGQMVIPADRMASGLWHLEVDWQAGGTKYFQEATVTITRA